MSHATEDERVAPPQLRLVVADKSAGLGTMPTGLPLRALPLFIFLHVPKTAGTSTKQVWRNMFQDYYFQFDPAIHRVKEGESAVWQQAGFFDRYLMIGGHAAYNHGLVRRARNTKRRVIFVATFRDPPARAASHYDFIRKRPGHPLYKELMDRSLLEAIESDGAFRRQSINAQLIQVFGTDDPELIAEVLARENYIIGRQDQLDDFLDVVAAISGLPRPQRVVRANAADEPGPVAAEPARMQPTYSMALEKLSLLNEREIEFMTAHLGSVLVTTSRALAKPVLIRA